MRFLVLLLVFYNFAFCETTGARIAQELKEKNDLALQEHLDNFDDDGFDDFMQDDESFDEFHASEQEVYDPLISYNRWMTGVNDSLILYIVEPASDGYGYVVPTEGRQGINNFFKNLQYPVSLISNLLQFEIIDGGTESARFLINSTLGLLGFFDPADALFDIKPKREDLGQTLGYYGVGSGMPIVLPFFGQKNLRDLTGTFAESFIDPIYYVNGRFYNTVEKDWQSIMIKGYDDFNEYSLSPGAYPALTKDTIDLYPFLRDAYEQHRNQLIQE